VQAYRCARSAAPALSERHRRHPFPLVLGPFVQSGVYDLPLVHYESSGDDQHRPGRRLSRRGPTGSVFIVERLMDAAARQIGMDRAPFAK